MPQSLSRILLHLVFSTKGHEPWIDANVRPGLHAYLAGACRGVHAEAHREQEDVNRQHAARRVR